MTEIATDEQITAMISDPATISSHEQALEVIQCLENEIADIQSQVDCAQIEANARPLGEDRQKWLRRATYAAAMRKHELHRVVQRDKELRGTKGSAKTEAKRDPGEGILKQERLKSEADLRRERLNIERERLQIARDQLAVERSRYRKFYDTARRLLPAEKFR